MMSHSLVLSGRMYTVNDASLFQVFNYRKREIPLGG
jgi:hypothetical protein